VVFLIFRKEKTCDMMWHHRSKQTQLDFFYKQNEQEIVRKTRQKITCALKGDGTSVAVLHLYDSFHQKCSKLGTYTTQDLKNNFYLRGFSISSGPEPRLSDEYRQFF
jgi:hypothetical protein